MLGLDEKELVSGPKPDDLELVECHEDWSHTGTPQWACSEDGPREGDSSEVPPHGWSECPRAQPPMRPRTLSGGRPRARGRSSSRARKSAPRPLERCVASCRRAAPPEARPSAPLCRPACGRWAASWAREEEPEEREGPRRERARGEEAAAPLGCAGSQHLAPPRRPRPLPITQGTASRKFQPLRMLTNPLRKKEQAP